MCVGGCVRMCGCICANIMCTNVCAGHTPATSWSGRVDLTGPSWPS